MSNRSLDCPKCGAPLDWTGDANVVECEYCESHIAVADRTITQAAAQTKARSTAVRPAVPPPPLPEPQPAARPRRSGRPQPTPQRMAVAITLGVLTVALALGIPWLVKRRGGGTATPSEELLRGLEMKMSQPDVVALLDSPSTTQPFRVTVDFRAGLVRRAEVYWEPPDTVNVTSVNLFGQFDVPAIVDRLRPLAPNRLDSINDKSSEIRVAQGVLSISPGAVTVRTDKQEDRLWQPRLAAFWAAVRFAVLGGAEPTAEERRLLNGPRLPEAARLDVALTVETAADAFREAFPGGFCRTQAGLLCMLDVDDPRVEQIRFGWPNAVKGRLREVALMFPLGAERAKAQQSLAACLQPALGEGTEEVTDHIKGTRKFTWAIGAGGDAAVLQPNFLGLITAGEAPPDHAADWPAKLPAVLEAVAGCK